MVLQNLEKYKSPRILGAKYLAPLVALKN